MKNINYQRLNDRILDNTIEAIVVTDTTGRILQVNRAFSQITGYSAEEALGKTPSMLRSGRHPGSFYQAMWQQIEHKGHWSGEVWNRRKTGEIYLQWLSVNALKNDRNETTHYVAISHDLSELRAREAEIEFLAFHDPLTRLGNRQLLMSQLEQTFNYSKRTQRTFGLMILDVGRLRPINDHFGMNVGDEIIQIQAERLHLLVSDQNTLVRLQGDTFAIICRHPNDEVSIARLAKKLLKSLSRGITLQDKSLLMRPSIGIALFPLDALDRNDLLQAAEHAHQAAKRQGRQCFHFFDHSQHTEQQRALIIEHALTGLVGDSDTAQLSLYYQPKICLHTQSLCGAEALLRWQHPEIGMISPGEFIPIAEQSSLSVRLDRWVLRRVCSQIHHWLQLGLNPPQIAVNLSAYQLDQEDFADWLTELVKAYQLQPQRLQLEITETAMIRNGDSALRLLSSLQHRGFSISLDDFGTGYSSLAYLNSLPLNELKIDQGFVQQIAHNERSLRLLESVVNLARNLNLEVVMEGVETQEQVELLRPLGALKVQGYFYYPPQPEDQWLTLLKMAEN